RTSGSATQGAVDAISGLASLISWLATTSACRTSAPISMWPLTCSMRSRPGMRLMSTRCAGVASRIFIIGRRLCPPARTLPSSPSSARSAVASSSVVGAEYSNGAGYTSHLPPVTYASPPLTAGRLGDPSPIDHNARRIGMSAGAAISGGCCEAIRNRRPERFRERSSPGEGGAGLPVFVGVLAPRFEVAEQFLDRVEADCPQVALELGHGGGARQDHVRPGSAQTSGDRHRIWVDAETARYLLDPDGIAPGDQAAIGQRLLDDDSPAGPMRLLQGRGGRLLEEVPGRLDAAERVHPVDLDLESGPDRVGL